MGARCPVTKAKSYQVVLRSRLKHCRSPEPLLGLMSLSCEYFVSLLPLKNRTHYRWGWNQKCTALWKTMTINFFHPSPIAQSPILSLFCHSDITMGRLANHTEMHNWKDNTFSFPVPQIYRCFVTAPHTHNVYALASGRDTQRFQSKCNVKPSVSLSDDLKRS